MSTLAKILIVTASVLAALAVMISVQPSEYRVNRSATIAASPANVFPLVNDFHKWDLWSPWAKRDPAMKKTIEGSPAGPVRLMAGRETTRWARDA